MAKDNQHSCSFIGMKIVVDKRIFYYCLDIEVPSKLSWLLENFDHKLFDLKSMMTSACTFDNISLVRSMTDKFGIEMFQSRHIMQFAVRDFKSFSMLYLSHFNVSAIAELK
jgi:hypothetical protein